MKKKRHGKKHFYDTDLIYNRGLYIKADAVLVPLPNQI